MSRRLLALTFAALLGAGCRTVEFGTGGTTPVTPTDTGKAELKLTNRLETDPGPLVFLLFKEDAQDVDAAPVVSRLATVKSNETATVKVPAGRWKLGYEEQTSDRSAMPADSIGGNPEWPKVAFSGNGAYSLTIETDDGGVTVWRSNIPTIAAH